MESHRARRGAAQDVVGHGERRGKQVYDRVEEGRNNGSRKPSAEERGGQGCDCIGGNRRETETFQGSTGWSITSFSKTRPLGVLRVSKLPMLMVFFFVGSAHSFAYKCITTRTIEICLEQ